MGDHAIFVDGDLVKPAGKERGPGTASPTSRHGTRSSLLLLGSRGASALQLRLLWLLLLLL